MQLKAYVGKAGVCSTQGQERHGYLGELDTSTILRATHLCILYFQSAPLLARKFLLGVPLLLVRNHKDVP